MIRFFLTIFSFGFLSAIATLLVQALLYTPMNLLPRADIVILVSFVFLEEFFKCTFLNQLLIRKIFITSFFPIGLLFGMGFFFVEFLLIYANPQENPFSIQILYILFIHIITSLLWTKALLQKKYFIPIIVLALSLHLLYNLSIYFFFV
jgi:hypothetical protein